MKRSKIVLYGHFGSGNIGNDSTFEAALGNIRQRMPAAEIVCVCDGPAEIVRRFGMPVLPINSLLKHRLVRQALWFRSVKLFVVVGTGAVDDMAVARPTGAPLSLLKWCLAARLGGAKVVFLSVGVGPIEHPVSRFLMLRALRLADSRSYRETAALDYLRNLGFDTSADRIYPDLVLSLNPTALPPAPVHSGRHGEVGLGVINYRGWRHDPVKGERVFRTYMGRLQVFLRWLLEKGYTVRLLTGDATDQASVVEMLAVVESGPLQHLRSRVIFELVTDVQGLFQQISRTDIVVACRFHNVLCSLMMKKPVVSIGYHAKNDLLMEAFGLGAYCQRIDNLDTDLLVRQFQDCEDRREILTRGIQARLDDFRDRLDEQYVELLSPVRSNA